MKFILLPFIAWLAAGFLKFSIHYLRCGEMKFSEIIGYGGFPSTHTSILASAVFSLGLYQGFFTPLFSFGLASLMVCMIDAQGLRRHVGRQAVTVNKLDKTANLQERMGHTWFELSGGLIVGMIVAGLFYLI
ncbi:divergent PAP2 family protein [Propionispira raffinosivorans]|uniref:divergent PAP2 family protein n=1 Tax=Propionispira raffinosivorans TaxID=86959 RepID=UPI0003736213|nr:divergent PAP2 family protein [Propionispira raffinosivorans]